MDQDRWSEENVTKRRLENLAKAREELKKKREGTSGGNKHFTVTPIVATPTPQVISKSDTDDTAASYGEVFRGKLSDFGYALFFSVSSLAISMAVPIVVDALRDAFLQHRGIQPDVGFAKENRAKDPDFYSAGSSGDIIFRKV
jgi:hypothetical protein